MQNAGNGRFFLHLCDVLFSEGGNTEKMKNHRRALYLLLAAFMAALCACRPAPERPAEPDNNLALASSLPSSEAAGSEKNAASSGEKSASSQSSSDSPESRPDLPAASQQNTASEPPSSSGEAQKIPASEKGSLLQGKNVSLLQGQWVDNERFALVTYYEDTDETLLLLYSRKTSSLKTLARFEGRPQTVQAPFYEEQPEFYLDNYSLSIDPEEEQAQVGVRFEESELLPQADAEYSYGNVCFSSSGKYFFYERFPNEYRESSLPASDRIFIFNASSFEQTPAGEIAFPFDVRTSPKQVMWLCGIDQLLVQADLPRKDEYDAYSRTYYVYTAGGREVTRFSSEMDLNLRDSRRQLLLLERAGEPYELFCLDYSSGKMQRIVSLEGENRSGNVVRFSPDAKEIAVLRPATDLTPQFYPVPEMK